MHIWIFCLEWFLALGSCWSHWIFLFDLSMVVLRYHYLNSQIFVSLAMVSLNSRATPKVFSSIFYYYEIHSIFLNLNFEYSVFKHKLYSLWERNWILSAEYKLQYTYMLIIYGIFSSFFLISRCLCKPVWCIHMYVHMSKYT